MLEAVHVAARAQPLELRTRYGLERGKGRERFDIDRQ